MESPVTVTEVLQSIKMMKQASVPGPDGFSAVYYQKFTNTLAPYLKRFFNSLRARHKLDPDMNTLFISVITKPGKDSGKVENYRPISLINNDLKLLTKI